MHYYLLRFLYLWFIKVTARKDVSAGSSGYFRGINEVLVHSSTESTLITYQLVVLPMPHISEGLVWKLYSDLFSRIAVHHANQIYEFGIFFIIVIIFVLNFIPPTQVLMVFQ